MTIDTQLSLLPPLSIVMSPDDRYVAFTLNDEVRVYEIGTKYIRKVSIDLNLNHHKIHSAGNAMTVEDTSEKSSKAALERKIQFSVDGKNLVVATHLGGQDAFVDVWNCSTEQWNIAPDSSRTFKLPPVGLSLVLRVSSADILTADSGQRTTKVPPVCSMTTSTVPSC